MGIWRSFQGHFFPKNRYTMKKNCLLQSLEIQRLAGGLRFRRNMVHPVRSANSAPMPSHCGFAGPGAGTHVAGTYSAGSRASAGQRDNCAGHQ